MSEELGASQREQSACRDDGSIVSVASGRLCLNINDRRDVNAIGSAQSFPEDFSSFDILASARISKAGGNRLDKFIFIAQADAVTETAGPPGRIFKAGIPALWDRMIEIYPRFLASRFTDRCSCPGILLAARFDDAVT